MGPNESTIKCENLIFYQIDENGNQVGEPIGWGDIVNLTVPFDEKEGTPEKCINLLSIPETVTVTGRLTFKSRIKWKFYLLKGDLKRRLTWLLRKIRYFRERIGNG